MRGKPTKKAASKRATAKPVKKQTGGKVATLKPKVTSEEKQTIPVNRPSLVSLRKKTKLSNNRDYPEDDLEIWKRNKLKGKARARGECYDLKGNPIKCPKEIR